MSSVTMTTSSARKHHQITLAISIHAAITFDLACASFMHACAGCITPRHSELGRGLKHGYPDSLQDSIVANSDALQSSK